MVASGEHSGQQGWVTAVSGDNLTVHLASSGAEVTLPASQLLVCGCRFLCVLPLLMGLPWVCTVQPEVPEVGDHVKLFSEDSGEVGLFVGQDAQVNDALVKYTQRGVVILERTQLVKVRG